MAGVLSCHKNGCVVWSVSLLGKGCCNHVKVGKVKVFQPWAGRRWLCNPWWKGMGDTRALFPALLCVFLATLGKLLLLMQPRVFKDALKSPD